MTLLEYVLFVMAIIAATYLLLCLTFRTFQISNAIRCHMKAYIVNNRYNIYSLLAIMPIAAVLVYCMTQFVLFHILVYSVTTITITYMAVMLIVWFPWITLAWIWADAKNKKHHLNRWELIQKVGK